MGSQRFDANGTFTVPANIIRLRVCMCGGGGSGSSDGQNGGGGFGGQKVQDYGFDVTPNSSIAVTCGNGGVAVNARMLHREEDGPIIQATNGNAGAASSFGSYVHAAGGAGGSAGDGNPYQGQGAVHSGCGGTYSDGSGSGGEWGLFGNGGQSEGGAGTGGSGGGNHSDNGPSGAGGRGVVVVNWDELPEGFVVNGTVIHITTSTVKFYDSSLPSGINCDRVYENGLLVWTQYVPTAITAFEAVMDNNGQVTISWPVVFQTSTTYELFEDGVSVMEKVAPGYTLSRLAGSSHTYQIKVKNPNGFSLSNSVNVGD